MFRAIILATFLPPEENAGDHHYQHTDFGGKIVLDPFMGSVFGNRLHQEANDWLVAPLWI